VNTRNVQLQTTTFASMFRFPSTETEQCSHQIRSLASCMWTCHRLQLKIDC